MRLTLLSLALACALPVAAHADTVIDNVSGTLVDGGTFSGSFELIFTNTAADPNNPGSTIAGYNLVDGVGGLTVSDQGNTYTLAAFGQGGTLNQPGTVFFAGPGFSSFFALDLPGYFPFPSNPIGSICSTNSPCEQFNSAGVDQNSTVVSSFGAGEYSTNVGSGAVVSATPEPSSFVLLGTGILGVAGAARRKFLKA